MEGKEKKCFEEDHCEFRAPIRNCFKERTVVCLNYGYECPFKKHMKNADGDVVEVCLKEE